MSKIKWKYEIGQVLKSEKRDLTIIDKKIETSINIKGHAIQRKWYRYYCNICGFNCGRHYNSKKEKYKEDLWITEDNLFYDTGCSCCKGIAISEGINDIPTTEPWMVKYFQGGYDEAKLYTRSSGKEIYPTCPDCGRIRAKKIVISFIYSYKYMPCTCSDGKSYPNKLSYLLLDQLNKIYKFDYLEHEYSPKWIGKMSYDNYFIHNNKQYILEMDGEWHSKDNTISGQTKEESKAIDDYKDKLAEEHGIEVIRVDCYKSELNFIKNNILNSNLSKWYDLSKLDWSKCQEFALSNLVKTACGYWSNGINSTLEISKIMKMDRHTIIRYLKRGSGIWCDYNAKEEMRKSGIIMLEKSRELQSKPVEVFRNGISLGIFPSQSELSRQSEKIFGIKFVRDGISLVCQGKQKQYKGYTFQYIIV